MLSFLLLSLILATPLILAAMGGLTSERTGVTNIGLEGLMLTAACVTAIGAWAFGPVGGLLCGVAASVLLSLLHWLVTQHYQIDHVISGMAVNLLAAGGTNFMLGKFIDPTKSDRIPSLPINFYLVAALVLPVGLWVYIRTTRGGLRMLAVGNDPDKARLVGVQPVKVRLFGLTATGVFCGLAGAMLVTDTGMFTDNMTSGKGYIALAALILGGWRPVPAMVACLAFGFINALQVRLQGTPVMGIQLPSQAWSALPYIATIIALAGLLGKNRTPAGIGKP